MKYDHLQVMKIITAKFHQNPLKNVGGVAQTRTSVDKMAKTDKVGHGPSFIIQFQYNFTQVLGMTIPLTSSHFSMIGSRSRSQ